MQTTLKQIIKFSNENDKENLKKVLENITFYKNITFGTKMAIVQNVFDWVNKQSANNVCLVTCEAYMRLQMMFWLAHSDIKYYDDEDLTAENYDVIMAGHLFDTVKKETVDSVEDMYNMFQTVMFFNIVNAVGGLFDAKAMNKMQETFNLLGTIASNPDVKEFLSYKGIKQ